MLRKLTAAFLIICLLFSFAHAQKNSWKKRFNNYNGNNNQKNIYLLSGDTTILKYLQSQCM